MIRFEEVTKTFGQKTVLKAQSFEIEDGEFLVLVGPSGSGKTTLLKMINRLVEPTSGVIKIGETTQDQLDLRQMRLSMGYVLQQIALFPNLTVLENILVIPEMKHWPKAKAVEKAKSLLAKVGLAPEDYADRYPRDLSGGEQQRVGIVRAIVAEPSILLMDEPFSALDAISRKQLQDLTKELHQELGITVVFVTHDTDEALKLADRIAVLHEGELVQMGTPEAILAQPANPFVADLFGGHHHVTTD